MPAIENEIDASFYSLIHQLTGSPQSEPEAEQRRRPRRTFASSHRIAPWRGSDSPPEESDFFDVPCHDLSRSGFSYFVADPPDYEVLVAAFGDPPNTICLRAEVRHIGHVLVYPSGAIEQMEERAKHVSYQEPSGEQGEPMVLVGCRFTERIQP